MQHVKTLLKKQVAVVTTDADPEQEPRFMARELVQCTLPHSDPGDVPAWSRSTGNGGFLGIRPGWDFNTNHSLGIPYGPIPRLLLFWLTTEAVRNKNNPEVENPRRIELGDNLTQFMENIGLSTNTGRGKRGGATRLRNQIERLFTCQISFQRTIFAANGAVGKERLDMQVAPRSLLWWTPQDHKQGSMFNSYIELGEYFYEMITTSVVPLDMEAIRGLKQSSMALDLYAMLNHRTFVVNHITKEPAHIEWSSMMKQMGTSYAAPKELARHMKKAMRLVQIHSPGLDITFERSGIVVHPGTTAISPKTFLQTKSSPPWKPSQLN